MLKRYFLSVKFFFSLLPIFAQFVTPSKSEVLALIKRPLVVQLLDTTNGNDYYNNILIREVNEHWKYSQVVFVENEQELLVKVKSFENECTILSFLDSTLRVYQTKHEATGIGTSTNAYKVEIMSHRNYMMLVRLSDANQPTICIGLANNKVKEKDIIFLGQQLGLLLDAAINDKNLYNYIENLEKVKQTKLYINEKDFSESGKAYLAKNFPYPYEFVSDAKYMNIILAREPGVYYLKFIYSQEFMMRNAFAVVDAGSGRILLRTSHLNSECKNTSYGKNDTNMNDRIGGMCASYFVKTIYDVNTQTKKFQTQLSYNSTHR